MSQKHTDTLNALGAEITSRYPGTQYDVTVDVLRVHSKRGLALHVWWDCDPGTWRVVDRLAYPHSDAAYGTLDSVAAALRQRHPEPKPAYDPQHTHDVMAELAAAWVGPSIASSRRARLELNALILEGLEVDEDEDDPGAPGVWAERARVDYKPHVAHPGERTWALVRGNDKRPERSGSFVSVWGACWEVARVLGIAQPTPAPEPEPKPKPTPTPTEPLCPLALDVQAVCAELVELIDRKNKAYGNSATQPLAVFSRLGTLDRLAVRIDDKLSRLGRGSEDAKAAVPEDTVLDLIGYLMIYLVESRKG